jgi:hypothetical protein
MQPAATNAIVLTANRGRPRQFVDRSGAVKLRQRDHWGGRRQKRHAGKHHDGELPEHDFAVGKVGRKEELDRLSLPFVRDGSGRRCGGENAPNGQLEDSEDRIESPGEQRGPLKTVGPTVRRVGVHRADGDRDETE